MQRGVGRSEIAAGPLISAGDRRRKRRNAEPKSCRAIRPIFRSRSATWRLRSRNTLGGRARRRKALARIGQRLGARRRAEFLLEAAAAMRRRRFRTGGLGSLRVRQRLARSRRRRLRSDRLLRILRPRRRSSWQRHGSRRAGRRKPLHLHAARRGGRHRAVEFSAGDSHRHDRRRAGHRQHGGHEAGRAIERHRREADGDFQRNRTPAGRGATICRARAKWSARRWSSIPTWR